MVKEFPLLVCPGGFPLGLHNKCSQGEGFAHKSTATKVKSHQVLFFSQSQNTVSS